MSGVPTKSANDNPAFQASFQPITLGQFCMVQVAITLVHLLRLSVRSEYVSILVASQCLLLWLKIQYFARSGILHALVLSTTLLQAVSMYGCVLSYLATNLPETAETVIQCVVVFCHTMLLVSLKGRDCYCMHLERRQRVSVNMTDDRLCQLWQSCHMFIESTC